MRHLPIFFSISFPEDVERTPNVVEVIASKARAKPVQDIQGYMYLAHKKHPPPQDHYRSLGIGLLWGLAGGGGLINEQGIPVYLTRSEEAHWKRARPSRGGPVHSEVPL